MSVESYVRVLAPIRKRGRHFLARYGFLTLGALLAIAIVLIAALAPVLVPFDPAANDFSPQGGVAAPPSSIHWLGTDELGRDVLSRLIWGSRASMEAGVFATVLAFTIAIPLGLLAGFYRRIWDSILMRLTDTILAFPFLIIAVGLAAILGPSIGNATLAIGVTQVPKLLRITRGEVIALREESYIEAAVADGAPDRSILFRHILPNTINMIVVQATVILPAAILAEATLSFLGLGVQPPTPSWGVMLTTAQPYMHQAPWLAIFPGIAIVVTVLAFNLLGEGVRVLLDPRSAS
jgi:peptide/nickel transport system permease protein